MGIALTALTTALLTSSLTIPTNGTVTPTPTPTATPTPSPTPSPTPTPTPTDTASIGVYADSGLTQKYTTSSSITWSAVMPGQNTTKTVYIKNDGTVAVTLHVATSNISPAGAVGKLTVTMDKEGQTLAVGATTTAVLTLSVNSTISGVTSYNLDVTIQGTSLT